MSERVMASVEVVEEVKDIDGADRLQHYRVKGWWVVDRKDAYRVGDHVVFCEIDSFVPESIAPFLTKGKPKTFNGVQGNVLKTIRLRGALSQGLLLSSSTLGDVQLNFFNESGRWALGVIPVDSDHFQEFIFVGDDVSERLGIVKYERLEGESNSNGNIEKASDWPHFIPKTDQERIQNYYKKLKKGGFWKVWEITEKLEGQSFTAYIFQGEIGVCSRNVRLKTDVENNWTRAFHKYNLQEKLPMIAQHCGFEFAIQGELCGPGIQGNIYGLKEQQLFIYNIRNLSEHRDLNPVERWNFHTDYFAGNIQHVPVHGDLREDTFQTCHNLCTPTGGFLSLDEILASATAPSALAEVRREGLVFKSFDGESFKAISNDYLELGHEIR